MGRRTRAQRWLDEAAERVWARYRLSQLELAEKLAPRDIWDGRPATVEPVSAEHLAKAHARSAEIRAAVHTYLVSVGRRQPAHPPTTEEQP